MKLSKLEQFVFFSAPHQWFQTSLELHETVKRLVDVNKESLYISQNNPKYQTVTKSAFSRGIYLMMAFSLENLLKGLLIRRNPELVSEGRLDRKLISHDLLKLSNSCDFENLAGEKDFLKLLSSSSVSTSRYPTGLMKDHWNQEMIFVDSHYKIYLSLFQKFKNTLLAEYKSKGWKSGLNNPDLDCEPGAFNYFENEFQ